MSQGYDGLPDYYVFSSDPFTPNLGLSLKGLDPVAAEDFVLIDSAFGNVSTLGGVPFYFDKNTPSDIPTYYSLLQQLDGAQATFPITVRSADGTKLIASFATGIGVPNTTIIPAGTWSFMIYATVDDVSKGATTLKFDFYARTILGVETLLFSASEQITETTPVTTNFEQTANAFVINNTDRLVIKVSVSTLSVSNRTVTFYTDGQTHFSHVHSTLLQPVGISGGIPSAPLNSIQFNNAGAFGGSANLIWDGTAVTITSAAAAVDLILSNPTAAVQGTPQSSPTLEFSGTWWNGSASAADQWTVQNSLYAAPNTILSISDATGDGVHVVYGFSWTGGPAPTIGQTVAIAGFTTVGFNGTFTITDIAFAAPATSHFTVVNATPGTEVHAATGTGLNYPYSDLTFLHSGTTNNASGSVTIGTESGMSAEAVNTFASGDRGDLRVLSQSTNEDGNAIMIIHDVKPSTAGAWYGANIWAFVTPQIDRGTHGSLTGLRLIADKAGAYGLNTVTGLEVICTAGLGFTPTDGQIIDMIGIDLSTAPIGPTSGLLPTRCTNILLGDGGTTAVTSYAIHIKAQTSGGIGTWSIYEDDTTNYNQFGVVNMLGTLGFSSAAGLAADTGFSRLGAASVALGNGTAGDASGNLLAGTVAVGAPTFSSSFTGAIATPNRNNFTGAVGFRFQVSSTVVVSKLGRFFDAGSTHNHVIKLWHSANEVTPMASGTILVASASDANGFKWVTLPEPIYLVPGVTYAVAIDETSGLDNWPNEWTPPLQAVFTNLLASWSVTQGAYPNDGVSPANDGHMFSTPALWVETSTTGDYVIADCTSTKELVADHATITHSLTTNSLTVQGGSNQVPDPGPPANSNVTLATFTSDIGGTGSYVRVVINHSPAQSPAGTGNAGISLNINGTPKWTPATYRPAGTNYSFTFYNSQTNLASLYINGDTDALQVGSGLLQIGGTTGSGDTSISRLAANSLAIGNGSAGDFSGSLKCTGLFLAGTLSSYNGVGTVSNGVAVAVATVDLTAQSAAITPTTIYAVPASGAGMYRISYVAKVTTVDTTSSVLGGANGYQVVYTDPADSVAVTTPVGPSNSANTTQAQINGKVIVYAKASTNIQHSIGYTGVTGDMRYNLHVKVEYLG